MEVSPEELKAVVRDAVNEALAEQNLYILQLGKKIEEFMMLKSIPEVEDDELAQAMLEAAEDEYGTAEELQFELDRLKGLVPDTQQAA